MFVEIVYNCPKLIKIQDMSINGLTGTETGVGNPEGSVYDQALEAFLATGDSSLLQKLLARLGISQQSAYDGEFNMDGQNSSTTTFEIPPRRFPWRNNADIINKLVASLERLIKDGRDAGRNVYRIPDEGLESVIIDSRDIPTTLNFHHTALHVIGRFSEDGKILNLVKITLETVNQTSLVADPNIGN